MSRIVVGVDGSPGARHALYWAKDEARRRGATIHVVTAWSEAADPQTPDSAAYAQRSQLREVETVLRSMPDSPPLSCSLIEGDPVDVLLDSSHYSDLLVLGSRELSQASARSGAVRDECVRRAACPVVVISAPHVSDASRAGAVEDS